MQQYSNNCYSSLTSMNACAFGRKKQALLQHRCSNDNVVHFVYIAIGFYIHYLLGQTFNG